MPLYLYWTPCIECITLVYTNIIFLDTRVFLITKNKHNISYQLIWARPCSLQSYSIMGQYILLSYMYNGKITYMSLISLIMICRISINHVYGYPIMISIWFAIKYLTPHLGSIMVSGWKVIYTSITMRIAYDTCIINYVVLSWWVTPV